MTLKEFLEEEYQIDYAETGIDDILDEIEIIEVVGKQQCEKSHT